LNTIEDSLPTTFGTYASTNNEQLCVVGELTWRDETMPEE